MGKEQVQENVEDYNEDAVNDDIIAGLKKEGLTEKTKVTPKPEDVADDKAPIEKELAAKPKAKKESAPKEEEKTTPPAKKEEVEPDVKAAKEVVKPSLEQIRLARRPKEEERNRAREEAERERYARERDQEIAKLVEDKVSAARDSMREEIRKDLEREIVRDPVKYFQDKGYDTGEMGTMLYADRMEKDGKEIPAHIKVAQKQMLAERGLRDENAQLRQQMEEMNKKFEEYEARQTAERAWSDIRDGHRKFLTEIPDEFTLLQKKAAHDKDGALSDMEEVVRQFARSYPEDAIPTAIEVAQYYEKHLRSAVSFLGDTGYSSSRPENGHAAQDRSQQSADEAISSDELQVRTKARGFPEDDFEAENVLESELMSGAYLK